MRAMLLLALVLVSCSSSSSPAGHGPCVPLGEPLECSPDVFTLKTCYRCVDDGDAGVCCQCCSP